jgi:transcriptional regulator with XRE-family HTH domain
MPSRIKHEYLLSLRLACDLTQEAMAERLRMPVNTYRHWENPPRGRLVFRRVEQRRYLKSIFRFIEGLMIPDVLAATGGPRIMRWEDLLEELVAVPVADCDDINEQPAQTQYDSLYIPRVDAEERALHSHQDHQLILIFAPRKWGAEMFVETIFGKLQARYDMWRTIDLRAVRQWQQDSNSSSAIFFHGLLQSMDQFDLAAEHIGPHRPGSPKGQFLAALRTIAARATTMLHLHHAEVLFGYQAGEELLELIRSLIQIGETEPWNRLGLILSFGCHLEQYITRITLSGILNTVGGKLICLTAFEKRDVQRLTEAYHLAFSEEQLMTTMDLFGGHPAWTDRFFGILSRQGMSAFRLLADNIRSGQWFEDTLRKLALPEEYLSCLAERPNDLMLLKRLAAGELVQLRPDIAFPLFSRGLLLEERSAPHKYGALGALSRLHLHQQLGRLP